MSHNEAKHVVILNWLPE